MNKGNSRLLGALALAAAFGIATAPAFAGECPADQVRPGAISGEDHMEGKGVTDTVLAVSDLGVFHPELSGRLQRIRLLVVEPGGEVGWHAHNDRPAMIYITEGAIDEYRSDCAVPIEHKAGEVAAEIGELAHWWKNNADKVAKLISVDLPKAE